MPAHRSIRTEPTLATMPTRAKLLLCAVLIAVICGPVAAGAYRWIDENGVTVYSQTPPPSGGAVRIKPQPGPTNAQQEAARERLKNQAEQSFDAEEAKKQAAAEQAKNAEEKAKRTESCKAARQNLETLQNLGNRMVRTADGRYLRLSENEVELEMRKAQQQVDKYCE